MLITRIERQKGQPVSYHLYCDELFLFGIIEDTLVHFALQSGRDYSDGELDSIRRYDQVMLCRDQALRLLKHHSHLASELRRKLLDKNYSTTEIDAVIDYLVRNKYLNDSDYLQRFIQDEIHLKKSGPLLIRKKLYEKGVAGHVVDQRLRELYPQKKMQANAREWLSKKKRKLGKTDPRKLRQKLAAFLVQKGFEWDMISGLVRDADAPDDI